MTLIDVQIQQRASRQSGAQPEGDDTARGRTGNQVEVVPDGLTVQARFLQVGQDLRRENALDTTAVD